MAELTDKLITFAYLKREVDLPTEILDEELDHKIYTAQETLRMLMGDEFYQDFKTKYKTNSFSAAYTTLYGYVKQYVAWQAYEGWIIRANFKPTRAGIRVMTEDNSVVATDIQMSTLIKDAKQKAQYYKMLFVDYLNDHSTDYPLYSRNCGNNLTGNTFHISAVKKNHHHKCKCHRCRL
jgi:hypothetical protein